MSGGAGKPGCLTSGMAIGPYTVDVQLGSGGFGFVYRVTRDRRAYALKIAHTKLGELREEDRAATIERLDREIAALKSLRHPNIVRVHSFDRWPEMETGYPYLVMDLVDGTALQEWRAVVTPSLARISVAFEKVADALAHMHELGIIHRDLKSQNILVTHGGEPTIVDFGIARPKVAYDVTRAAGVGTLTHLTPEYVAYLDSEAARNDVPFEWSPTTDLYALGFVLYESLTGDPPVPRFLEATPRAEAELLAAIKRGTPRRPRELNPRVPEALDILVMELLEKDPAKRPQEAAQVAERLRSAREAGEAAHDPVWVNPFDHAATPVQGGEGKEDAFASIDLPRGSPACAGGAPFVEAPRPAGEARVDLPTARKVAPYQDEGAGDGAGGPQDSPEPVGWGSESTDPQTRRFGVGRGIVKATSLATLGGCRRGTRGPPPHRPGRTDAAGHSPAEDPPGDAGAGDAPRCASPGRCHDPAARHDAPGDRAKRRRLLAMSLHRRPSQSVQPGRARRARDSRPLPSRVGSSDRARWAPSQVCSRPPRGSPRPARPARRRARREAWPTVHTSPPGS